MLARARANVRPRSRAEPKVYALLSTSPTIDLKLRARTLVEALAKLGKRACIVGEEASDMLSAWYDALEESNDAVFLVSPIADTSWFRICLRQADRIWVLGRADAVPSYPLLPADHSPARQFQLVDFVLLHHGSDRRAASPEQWRAACGASRIFHWRGLADSDAMRLARVIAGSAVGLVLSGGGARAYAHLGVLRALREAGVPIDAVGGTSMGAIIAACFAKGWSDDEIEMRIRDAFVMSNPLGDYVLPVVSLSRGKRVEQRLQAHFGDTMIEDLCTPFFCVATDLVSGGPMVRRSGLLRLALRGSISLPGILPPVVSEDGKALFVDGAVTDNFPVTTMAEQHRGPIIGVDVARRNVIDPARFANVPDFMGWVASRGFQSYPPIAELLMSAATVSAPLAGGRDRVDMLIVPEMPGVNLRDWKRFDEAVASGYQATVEALSQRSEALVPAAPAAVRPADPEEALLARA
jgi:NTE family protein